MLPFFRRPHFIKECRNFKKKKNIQRAIDKAHRKDKEKTQDIFTLGVGARLTLMFSPFGWCEHKRAGLAHGPQSVPESA